MAKANSTDIIPPFPTDIDRDAFGHWLSGFTDGEGCFYLNQYPVASSGRIRPQARFMISLRADDALILRQIRSYWQAGVIYNKHRSLGNHALYFCVEAIESLAHVVVPHFERYPLRAKKARDFYIWKEGVALLAAARKRPQRNNGKRRVGRYSADEITAFSEMVASLREQRKFESAPIARLVKRRTESHFPLFECFDD